MSFGNEYKKHGMDLIKNFAKGTVADKTGAQNFFSAFNYHYLLMVIAIVMKLY